MVEKEQMEDSPPLLLLAALTASFCLGGGASGSGMRAEGTPAAVSTPTPSTAESAAPSETAEATPRSPTKASAQIGPDQHITSPVSEGKSQPTETESPVAGDKAHTCTISISCTTILDNLALCNPDKVELVPEDGWILKPITVVFYEGESVFNVLQRTCKQQKIHLEFENTPIYNSAYIEGIHNLYEFDVGDLSGWMYSVNGCFPNYGCSQYALSDGDVISWLYTCDQGSDVGGGQTGSAQKGA